MKEAVKAVWKLFWKQSVLDRLILTFYLVVFILDLSTSHYALATIQALLFVVFALLNWVASIQRDYGKLIKDHLELLRIYKELLQSHKGFLELTEEYVRSTRSNPDNGQRRSVGNKYRAK